MDKFLLGVLAGITGLTLTALLVDKMDNLNCETFFKCSDTDLPSEEGKLENQESESEVVNADEK